MSNGNVASWYEVMCNNGDGSYRPLRFRTMKEALEYTVFFQVHDPEVLDSDAEVWEIDPTCPTFFHSAVELIQDWKDVNE